MEIAEREYVLARIIAGCLPCLLPDPNTGKLKKFILKTPTRIQRLIAQRIYQDVLHEEELDGALSEKELFSFLISEGVWDEKNDDKITSIEKDIEEFKVKLFSLTFKSNERKLIKKCLAKARAELNQLNSVKLSYLHASATGAAAIARARYIIGSSLHHLDGRPVFIDEDAFWRGNNSILECAFEIYNKERLSESQFRELARTEPWRSIWSSRKAEGSVFGAAACDLSDEQRNLVVWTGIYDNVWEHPECPGDDVVEDDDILDGWLIIQRRKRMKDKEASKLDQFVTNESVRNSQEVFILADTHNDAKAIENLNDAGGLARKRKRMSLIKAKGVVDEKDMPDSQLEIQALATQMFTEGKK